MDGVSQAGIHFDLKPSMLLARHPSAGWRRFSTAEWLVIQFCLCSGKQNQELDPSLRWGDEHARRRASDASVYAQPALVLPTPYTQHAIEKSKDTKEKSKDAK
jgi:hypothetical protein